MCEKMLCFCVRGFDRTSRTNKTHVQETGKLLVNPENVAHSKLTKRLHVLLRADSDFQVKATGTCEKS